MLHNTDPDRVGRSQVGVGGSAEDQEEAGQGRPRLPLQVRPWPCIDPVAKVELTFNGPYVVYGSDALVLSKTAGAKASFAGFAALNKCVVRILEDFDSTPPPIFLTPIYH
jgi:hypothetical protein